MAMPAGGAREAASHRLVEKYPTLVRHTKPEDAPEGPQPAQPSHSWLTHPGSPFWCALGLLLVSLWSPLGVPSIMVLTAAASVPAERSHSTREAMWQRRQSQAHRGGSFAVDRIIPPHRGPWRLAGEDQIRSAQLAARLICAPRTPGVSSRTAGPIGSAHLNRMARRIDRKASLGHMPVSDGPLDMSARSGPQGLPASFQGVPVANREALVHSLYTSMRDNAHPANTTRAVERGHPEFDLSHDRGSGAGCQWEWATERAWVGWGGQASHRKPVRRTGHERRNVVPGT